ncbi:Spherulation-specific family 4 [Macrophomina phaseolina MS6]|uniref:Spherulation-specific family 4 n=1 Tax=Macrophomina phaseolina (strain MS6) TaxID=1126212 RepID=K2RK67_MACPH|nr:Spherulation-specific family 4 [Macrophomina phaseolina MS6]
MFKRALCLLAIGSQLFSQAASAQAAAALVPAYIYPEPGDWQPLYTQLTNHPDVFFNIIINPNSGPGEGTDPGTDYVREITQLRTYSNVRLVGYVALNYTNKPIATVKSQVAQYAGWPAAIRLDGVFFDEAPSDADAAKVAYVQDAITAVRASSGLGSDPYVVTNPGYPPARPYLYNEDDGDLVPDLSLVYEEAYSSWTANAEALSQTIWDLDVDDGELAIMLHDFPTATACADITALVNDFKGNVGVGTLWFTNDPSYGVWPDATLWNEYLNAFVNGGSAC